MEFNNSQRKVINEVIASLTENNPDPIFLTAPAASGKTATAIGIVEHLIKNSVIPESILLTSFTVAGRKAFEEKSDQKNIPYQTKHQKTGLDIRTFHSLLLELINVADSGRKYHYNPVPSHNKAGAVGRKKGKEEKASNYESFDEFIETFLERNSKFKTKYSLGMLRRYYLSFANDGLLCPQDLKTAFSKYFQDSFTITYDNVLNWAEKRFDDFNSAKKNKKYAQELACRYKVIIIDEFQDTSKLQWECFQVLLKEIISRGRFNLIVGDVKQSIYRWRGGDWRCVVHHNPLREPTGTSNEPLPAPKGF